ncbi:RNA-directed DNA polymerase, eukaryota [Tanacetum coccineum]
MKEQATNNDEDGVNLSGQDQFVHGREVNDDNNVIMRRSFKLAKSVARRRREAVGATGKGTEHKVNSDDYKVAHRKEVESGNIIFKATRAGSGSPSGLALSGSINSMRIGRVIRMKWQAEMGSTSTIQEMKCKRVADQWVENVWGTRNFGFVQIEARGRSGGLLLVWDTNSFSVKQSVREDRFVAVMGTWKGRVGYIIFVNVYGPHPSNQKGALWKRLEELINSNDGAWCLLGDFNEVRNLDDRLNTQFHARDSDEFNTFIANTRMVEVPMGGRRFTRVREDGMKFSKLDRFLISEEFKQMWGNLAAVALDRKLSDHCPIVLKYIDVDFGPRPFRSLDMWLNELDIEQVVAEAWAKPVRVNRQDCIVRGKFKNVKMALKRWSKARFGAIDNQIKKYQEKAMRWELEAEARYLSEDELKAWMEARRLWIEKDGLEEKNLESRFTEKEIWEAVSRCCSDKAPGPDGFNFRFIKKFWEIVKEEIITAVHWFWESEERIDKGLYTSIILLLYQRLTFASNRVSKLSGIEEKNLESRFTEKEIWEAVSRCCSDKAPGPDGFNFHFIKKFWEIVKEEIITAVHCRGVNVLVKDAVDRGIFNGVDVGREKIVVSHLQYADDTIFFGEWNKQNTINLMCIMKGFEKVSGLKVNLNKSKVYGVGVSRGEVEDMERCMRCSVGELPITYLGLPVGVCMRSESSWCRFRKFKNVLRIGKLKRCHLVVD